MGQIMTSHTSCREYLLAAFQTAKRGKPTLTLEAYATQLGMGVSAFKMILTGKRNLTVHQALKVSRALKLSMEDTAILETLALRDSASDAWERTYFTRRLRQCKESLKVRSIQTSERTLLHDPLALPLLVYLLEERRGGSRKKGGSQQVSPKEGLEESEELDYEKLGRSFKVKAERIRALVEDLKGSKILPDSTGDNNASIDSSSGRYHVFFDRLNHKNLQKKYMKTLLSEASRRVDTEYDTGASSFVGYTFATSEAALDGLREELKTLMDKYLAESPERSGPWQIVQACFQLFPLARF